MPREKARRALARAFSEGGIESPNSTRGCFYALRLGLIMRASFATPTPRSGGAADALRLMAARRLRRESVSRIIGYKEFWGERFALSSAVLDPRPDTETLIEAALNRLAGDRDRALRILDLGVGSGAILGALLRCLPLAFGVGVDISPAACAIAQSNLAMQGLDARGRIICGDWTAALRGRFDLVVSNPPIFLGMTLRALRRKSVSMIRALPSTAAKTVSRLIAPSSPALPGLLEPHGVVALEFGLGQGRAVAALLQGRLSDRFQLGDLTSTDGNVLFWRS